MAVNGLNVQFKSNTGKIQGNTGQFIENVPAMQEATARKFADDLEEAIKQSVRRKFDRHDGQLHDNVKARKSGSVKGGARFEVTANAYNNGVNYAAWHEYAKQSHDAPVSGELKRWGKQNGHLSKWGQTVEVTPINQTEGSFMEPAVQEAIKKARRRMRSGRNEASSGLQKAFGG